MTEKAAEKMDKTLKKQAARFHKELSKPPFRAPSAFSLIMFRMGRTGIRKSGLTELRDYSYYSERGWFEIGVLLPDAPRAGEEGGRGRGRLAHASAADLQSRTVRGAIVVDERSCSPRL